MKSCSNCQVLNDDGATQCENCERPFPPAAVTVAGSPVGPAPVPVPVAAVESHPEFRRLQERTARAEALAARLQKEAAERPADVPPPPEPGKERPKPAPAGNLPGGDQAGITGVLRTWTRPKRIATIVGIIGALGGTGYAGWPKIQNFFSPDSTVVVGPGEDATKRQALEDDKAALDKLSIKVNEGMKAVAEGERLLREKQDRDKQDLKRRTDELEKQARVPAGAKEIIGYVDAMVPRNIDNGQQFPISPTDPRSPGSSWPSGDCTIMAAIPLENRDNPVLVESTCTQKQITITKRRGLDDNRKARFIWQLK